MGYASALDSAALHPGYAERRRRLPAPARRWLALALALLAAASMTPGASAADCTPPALLPLLAEGDLLFRHEQGAASGLFAALGRDGRYAHGGIVVRDARQGLVVVHAFTHDWNADEPMHQDTPAAFLAKARAAGLYRPLDARQAPPAAARAAAAQRAGLPFDRRFDLSDQRAMYCTELLWWAYQLDGGVPTATGRARLGGFDLLPISRFTRGPEFREVATCTDGH